MNENPPELFEMNERLNKRHDENGVRLSAVDLKVLCCF